MYGISFEWFIAGDFNARPNELSGNFAFKRIANATTISPNESTLCCDKY